MSWNDSSRTRRSRHIGRRTDSIVTRAGAGLLVRHRLNLLGVRKPSYFTGAFDVAICLLNVSTLCFSDSKSALLR